MRRRRSWCRPSPTSCAPEARGPLVGPCRPLRLPAGLLTSCDELALGLLVEAEHDRPGWRVQVQADHVDQLLLEAGIIADLERVDLPRLETVVGPDLGDGVLADPDPGGQRAGAPARRAVGRSLVLGQPQHLSPVSYTHLRAHEPVLDLV